MLAGGKSKFVCIYNIEQQVSVVFPFVLFEDCCIFCLHSADLNMLSFDTLESRRFSAKSEIMYKILNDYTALGLRGSFVRREIHQTNYHLRHTATDLKLPKPKREFLKSLSNIVALCSGINSLGKKKGN